MTTVVMGVRTLDETFDDVEVAWQTGVPQTPRISFISYELMHKTLAPPRMAIIRALTGAGPLSIREVARRVGRDFKGVHTDVTALIHGGVIDRTKDGVAFPYDTIRFEFEISSAA